MAGKKLVENESSSNDHWSEGIKSGNKILQGIPPLPKIQRIIPHQLHGCCGVAANI
jgi:hypothetical protein